MKKLIGILSMVMTLSCNANVKGAKKVSDEGKDKINVLMQTSHGDVTIELDAKNAPLTVKNFLAYADNGFYDGTIFHRVIKSFMIQGGGFTEDMKKKSTEAPIKNEAHNGLVNDVGTIAMARTGVVDSATSQFFINTNNNGSLNHKGKSTAGYGYAVFGRVTKGMDVVRRIEMTATTTVQPYRDVPAESIVIKKITRL